MASRGKTKERLQQAALRLFSKSGFNGVSTKEIAKAAETTEVTLFRHFPTKGELYGAAETTEVTLFRHFPTKGELYGSLVEQYWKTPSMQYLESGCFSGQWHTDLKRFAGLLHQACKQNEGLLEMLLKDGSPDSLEPWQQFTMEIGDRMTAYLEQHWKTSGKISSQELSNCLCNGMIGLALRQCLNPFKAEDQDYNGQADLMISAFYLWVQHQE